MSEPFKILDKQFFKNFARNAFKQYFINKIYPAKNDQDDAPVTEITEVKSVPRVRRSVPRVKKINSSEISSVEEVQDIPNPVKRDYSLRKSQKCLSSHSIDPSDDSSYGPDNIRSGSVLAKRQPVKESVEDKPRAVSQKSSVVKGRVRLRKLDDDD